MTADVAPVSMDGKKPVQLSTRQYAMIVIGLGLGTMLEWYDFTCYASLNTYLTAAFFPPGDPVLTALAYWGVYAIGFVSRPIGALIFGHVGDTRGRRATLLLSIAAMATPTVLIGCLPTYQQIGIAAPILLALLRLIQGLAMGGEFGSAICYLFEIAPPRHKASSGNSAFVAAMLGIIAGNLVVLIVEMACSPGAMAVWGWRIPFLIVIFSAALSFLLRMNMPEPQEFLASREAAEEAIVQRIVSRQLSRRASQHSGGGGAFARSASAAAAAAGTANKGGALTSAAAGAAAAKLAASAPATLLTAATPRHAAGDAAALRDRSLSDHPAAPAGDLEVGVEDAELAQLRAEASKHVHRVPLVELMRSHWLGVIGQILFEAWASTAFYTFQGWFPATLRAKNGMPPITSLAMLITALLGTIAGIVVTSIASDRGMRNVYATLVIVVMGVGAAFGTMAAEDTNSLGAIWACEVVMLTLAGCALALIAPVAVAIYPARVRTSGINFAHNVAMGILGGLTPTVITAIAGMGTGIGANYAPAWWLLSTGALTVLGCILLLVAVPQTNKPIRQL